MLALPLGCACARKLDVEYRCKECDISLLISRFTGAYALYWLISLVVCSCLMETAVSAGAILAISTVEVVVAVAAIRSCVRAYCWILAGGPVFSLPAH